MSFISMGLQTLKGLIKSILPPPVRRSIKSALIRTRQFGLARYCPVCRARLKHFLPYGAVPRSEARCPICGCLERHRLIWLYFQKKTDLFDGRRKKMLHVAPEQVFAEKFEKMSSLDYLSADLDSPLAKVRMDIRDIQYPDDSFDVICCSHVLEHVEEDRQAMAEFHRVLRPGGWAILQVPILGEKTFEDPSMKTPEERERVFGQHNHVRIYGRDYKDRLEAAGFTVHVDSFARQLGEKAARYFGLDADEDVYFCQKR